MAFCLEMFSQSHELVGHFVLCFHFQFQSSIHNYTTTHKNKFYLCIGEMDSGLSSILPFIFTMGLDFNLFTLSAIKSCLHDIDGCIVIDLIYLLTIGSIIVYTSFSVSLPFAQILLLVLFN